MTQATHLSVAHQPARPPKTNGKVIELPKRERKSISSQTKADFLVKPIQDEFDGIAEGIRTTAERAIKAGQLLNQAKELIGHGRFCKWCIKHFPSITTRTRQRYQQLALMYEKEQANASPTTHLEEVLLEGGIEAALRRFQWRAEELPPPPQTDRSCTSSGDGENDDNTDTKASHRDGRGLKRWVASLYSRADRAIASAQIDGDWSRYRDLITPDVLDTTRRAAEAWQKAYAHVQQLYQPPLREAAE
jgi:hypothetical protein